ncbi:MAG: tRNA (adenosine(37)-N6)-threonylcarbamoyltransferase complex dimerization subunit type 1 TsaB [Deltaproteobacteria bacterium]|nr:tRNA (adenosine(37)-N6)-threonylcarbamoyltransferase complex dimerization subunit type 1 TsaB [Candidatus Tharpella sp.]
MSLTLAVDCCTETLSLALLRDGGALVELRLAVSEPHSKTLLSAVDWALAQASLEAVRLERLVVGCGPGSFSGLRIGMATMQGLSQALSIPLYTFIEPDLVAWKFAFHSGVFAVLTDARRQQVYWASYVSDGEKVERLSTCRVDDPETLAQLLPEADILLVGSGVDVYRSKLAEVLPESILLGSPQGLPDLSLLAQMPLLAGSPLSIDDGDNSRVGLWKATEKLEPLYVRPSDAELNRRKVTA